MSRRPHRSPALAAARGWRPVRAAALLCVLACPWLAIGAGAAAQDVDASAAGKVQDYSPFPQPGAGYVSDNANLLGPEHEERIERWLWQIESRTGVEIVVVTIGSIRDYEGAPNRDIEQFATALFDRYGIGNLPANDGVLLLVAVGDRKARIELGGGYTPSRDVDAARIMDGVIVPAFKQGDYRAGITDGVKAIALEFADVRIGYNWLLIGLVAAVPILGLVAFSLFKNGKHGWGWVVVGLLIVVVLVIVYMLVQVVRHLPQGRSGSWASGGFGGGFGGGSSGGGGATGSW